MVYFKKKEKDVDNKKYVSDIIRTEKLRKLRYKILSIPFFTMLGIWIIVYYQFTSHYHHPENGIKYGDIIWRTVKIVQK